MKTNKVALVGILSGLMIVFTLLSDYIQIGNISLNLALIVIVVAAIKCSKAVAMGIGFINGLMILLAPSTVFFFSQSLIGTILVCLLKTTLAGLLASYIYQLVSKHNKHLALILTSITVPVVNTGIFIIGSLIFFQGAFGSLINLFLSFNFIIEVASTLVLSLGMNYLLK